MKRFDSYYVGGRWHSARGDAVTRVVNPFNEQVIAEVRGASLADVTVAAEAASAALREWSRSTLDERKRFFRDLSTALESRRDAFVAALAEEIGCPVQFGRILQNVMPITHLSYALDAIDQIAWETVVRNSTVVREPSGVVLGITPWNAPLHQIVAKTIGALGAGCTLVLKPSEAAPTTVSLFFDAIAECALPPGVVNFLWGDADVAQALIAHPAVDVVSFTGSAAVGRSVMAGASAGLKRVLLELGGKTAAVVLPDADLDRAVPAIVRSCMMNAGQTCVAQTRLVVPHDLEQEVVSAVVLELERWVVGDPHDPATCLGPVASARQFERTNAMIREALDGGARLLTGGPGRPAGLARGYFVRPTALAATPTMRIAKEEVFGPVLTVLGYQDADQAVEIANATVYGLSGAVWGRNEETARKLARRLRTGQVIINGAPQNLAAPFGGFGQSGFGRENGRFGIESLTEYKAIQG